MQNDNKFNGESVLYSRIILKKGGEYKVQYRKTTIFYNEGQFLEMIEDNPSNETIYFEGGRSEITNRKVLNSVI
jgi:hypothetical protein